MSTPLASLGNRSVEQLKVAELREELKLRGINVKGLKKDLVDRLAEVLRQEEEQRIANEAAEAAKAASAPGLEEPELETLVPEKKLDESEKVLGSAELPESVDDVSPVRKLVLSEGNGEAEAELKPSGLKPTAKADAETGDLAKEENGLSESDKPGVGAELAQQELEPGVDAVEESEEEKIVEPTQEPDSKPESVSEPTSLPPLTPETKVTPVELPELEEIPGEPEAATLGLDKSTVEDRDVNPNVEVKPSAVVETESVEDEVIEGLKGDVSEGYQEEGLIVKSERGQENVLSESEPVVKETGDVDVAREVLSESEPVVEERVKEDVPMEVPIESEPVVELGVNEDVPMEEPSESDVAKGETPSEGHMKGEVMDVGEEWKVKALKPMEIDADMLAGSKRKDGDGELRSQEPTKRQRRWNSGKSAASENDARPPPKLVTTDSLKATTVREPREVAPLPSAPSPSVAASSTPNSDHAGVSERVAISRGLLSRTDTAVNGDTQKTRVVPPSLKAPTTSLKIDRFLRPFTFKAVKELLAQTGSVQDVWMDPIKTHCYVTYSTVDEATATRNALYNLQWPPQVGRLLTAEFVEPGEVKSRCNGEKTVVTPVTTPRGLPETVRPTSENAGPVPPPGHPPPSAPIPASALPPPPPLPPPPRDRPPMPIKQDMEPQSPTLDDLFKKTRAKPHIYYMPLTEQDVRERLSTRNQTPMAKPAVKV